MFWRACSRLVWWQCSQKKLRVHVDLRMIGWALQVHLTAPSFFRLIKIYLKPATAHQVTALYYTSQSENINSSHAKLHVLFVHYIDLLGFSKYLICIKFLLLLSGILICVQHTCSGVINCDHCWSLSHYMYRSISLSCNKPFYYISKWQIKDPGYKQSEQDRLMEA